MNTHLFLYYFARCGLVMETEHIQILDGLFATLESRQVKKL